MAFSVRTCSESEALAILQDRSVAKLLSIKPERISTEFVRLLMDEILLVIAKPDNIGVEVHVACRFRDRAKVRDTMKSGMQWLQGRGFNTIWTTAPDDRKGLVKMLESLGFRKVNERWLYGN